MKFNHRGAQKKSRQGNLTHQSTPPAKLTKSHSLAPTARSEGGYSDETDFLKLGDLIAIHRAPEASNEAA